MKKLCLILLMSVSALGYNSIIAQSQEAQQLLLNVEKLAQLKAILSKMKNGYEVISRGYEKIKSLSKGNFDLHKIFLDGLLQVSPTVRNYQKAAAVIASQRSILQECQKGTAVILHNPQLSVSERQYLTTVQDNIRSLSLKHLEEFAMVMTSGKLRMSDGERLEAIDRIYAEMQDKLAFVRQFNNSNQLLLGGRKMEQYDVNTSRKLHGVTP